MAKKKEVTIVLPELKLEIVDIDLVGVTPLIVNHFSEKSKRQMLDKQMKKATPGKEAKDPDEQYLSSLYVFEDGNFKKTGFPAVGFKASMTRGAKQLGMNMTDARAAFHVLPDDNTSGLVEIKGKHRMREDTVRLSSGVSDIRFRAEYQEWSCTITVQFNAALLSVEQVFNIANTAGFACGIGEWRPEKSNSGSFGLYKVKVG